MASILSLPEKDLTRTMEKFKTNHAARYDGLLPAKPSLPAAITAHNTSMHPLNSMSAKFMSLLREISKRMFARLPREIRDSIYESVLHDAPKVFCIDDLKTLDQRPIPGDTGKIIPTGSIFQNSYFHVSCVGPDFVRELQSIYLHRASFTILGSYLVGNAESSIIFSTDYFNIGQPIGDLLHHVEVILHNKPPADGLHPLLAISNKNCVIELSVPSPWTAQNNWDLHERGSYFMVSMQGLLDELRSTLRDLRGKGYCVRVRYRGIIISTGNDQSKFKWFGAMS